MVAEFAVSGMSQCTGGIHFLVATVRRAQLVARCSVQVQRGNGPLTIVANSVYARLLANSAMLLAHVALFLITGHYRSELAQ